MRVFRHIGIIQSTSRYKNNNKWSALHRFYTSDPGCHCWSRRSGWSAAGQRGRHWGPVGENQRHTSLSGLFRGTPRGDRVFFFLVCLHLYNCCFVICALTVGLLYLQVVELLLLRGANKEHRNVSDYTPLSLAASGGYVNIIKILLNAGAEINSRYSDYYGLI